MAAIKTDLILNAIHKGFEDVNKKIGDTNKLLGDTKKRGEESSKSTALLGKAFGVLGGALAALGLGITIKQLGQFAWESTMLAARVETLGVVTQTLGKTAGYTRQEITDLERSIQKQGITTQASRQSLALMMQAQIDLTHATGLARLAQDAAVVANINSSEAFQRLIMVITSGNVIMARRMGLQVNFNQGYQILAERLGKSTLELTANEKAQERVNIVMKEGAQIAGAYENAMDTVGKQVLSTARYWEEYKLAVGQANVGLLGYVNTVVQKVLSAEAKRLNLQHAMRQAVEFGIMTEMEMYRINGKLVDGTLDYANTISDLTDKIDLRNQAIIKSNNLEEISLVSKLGIIDAELEMVDAIGESTEKVTSFLDAVNVNISSPIEKFIDDLEWFIATGGSAEAIFDGLVAAAETAAAIGDTEGLGKIRADAILLDAAIIDVQGKMENLYPSEIASKINNDLGIPFQEALAFVSGTDGLEESLARLSETEWMITVHYNLITSGSIPSGMGAPGGSSDRTERGGGSGLRYAHGGQMQIGKDWSILGEDGFEIVTPDGFVLTHEESKRLLGLGFLPELAFQKGGQFDSSRIREAFAASNDVRGGRIPKSSSRSLGSRSAAGSSISGSASVATVSIVADTIVELSAAVATSTAAVIVQSQMSAERIISEMVSRQERSNKEIARLLQDQNEILVKLATADDISFGMKSAVGDLL